METFSCSFDKDSYHNLFYMEINTGIYSMVFKLTLVV